MTDTTQQNNTFDMFCASHYAGRSGFADEWQSVEIAAVVLDEICRPTLSEQLVGLDHRGNLVSDRTVRMHGLTEEHLLENAPEFGDLTQFWEGIECVTGEMPSFNLYFHAPHDEAQFYMALKQGFILSEFPDNNPLSGSSVKFQTAGNPDIVHTAVKYSDLGRLFPQYARNPRDLSHKHHYRQLLGIKQVHRGGYSVFTAAQNAVAAYGIMSLVEMCTVDNVPPQEALESVIATTHTLLRDAGYDI